MKKRKVLFLLPVAALILSGCTFQEGWETVKGWTGSNVYEPVKNWFMKLLGQEEQKKEDKKDEEKGGGEQGGGDQGGGGEQETTKYGTLENPLTIAEAKEIIEEECLGDGDLTKQAIYCYGEIKTVYSTHDYDTGPAFELDVKDDEAEVYVYRVHGKEEDKANCKVGSIIHFHGFAKNYSGTLEFCDNGKNQCTVDSLAKPQGTEAVTGIEFDNPAYEVQVGKTINVTASVLPLNAGNQNYTLSLKDLSPAGCVELLEGNKLKGVAEGSAKVVATSEEGNFTAEATVTISAAINYGSLDNPLTIEEAMAVINKESPTKEKVYVTGIVKSNKAYNTQYNNTEIWITDGTNDFELYGCNLPENFTPAQPAENDPALVGKEVIAHGTAKKYNSTYELDKGCAIDTVSEPAPIEIESVTVSPESADLEVGQQKILTATVAPAKASQEVKWSVQQTSEVVSVDEDGKVTALAEGEATVVATSDADSTKSGLCAITVTAATKTLDSIAIIGELTKSTYTEGEDYSAEGLKVMAHYDKGEDVDVTTLATITPSKEKAALNDTSVTFTATYSENNVEKTAEKAYDVVVNELKGTEEKPYSVSEAYAIFEGLADGENSEEFYFEGYIDSDPAPTISGGRGRFYLTDGVCSTHMYVYNANNTQNTNALTIDEIPVGAKALVRGAVKNYQGGFQVCYVSNVAQCQLVKAVEAPVITAVGAVTGPEEVGVDGTIDPASVTVAVTYSGIVQGTVQAKTVTGDFSAAGQATAYVTIDGWEATLEFTVTVVSGTVLTEQEVYKLDGTINGTGNAYNGVSTSGDVSYNNYAEQGGVKWEIQGNLTMNPWRIGGKSITDQDREGYSLAAVSADNITKVVISTGAASNCTVNSVTLKVGSTQGAKDVSEIKLTSNLVNADIEFARPEGADWSNCYFTFVFNVTVSATSNKFVEFKAATFYAMK